MVIVVFGVCTYKAFPALSEPKFHAVDAFAGKCSVALGFKQYGYKSCAHDILLSPDDESCLHICACMVFAGCSLFHAIYLSISSYLSIYLYIYLFASAFLRVMCPNEDILEPKGFVRHLMSVIQMIVTPVWL